MASNSNFINHRILLDEAEVVRRLNAKEILDGAAVDAAKKQIDLLESPNESVSLRAAESILDRTGHSKVIKTEGKYVSANIILDEKAVERLQRVTQQVFNRDFEFEIEGDMFQ